MVRMEDYTILDNMLLVLRFAVAAQEFEKYIGGESRSGQGLNVWVWGGGGGLNGWVPVSSENKYILFQGRNGRQMPPPPPPAPGPRPTRRRQLRCGTRNIFPCPFQLTASRVLYRIIIIKRLQPDGRELMTPRQRSSWHRYGINCLTSLRYGLLLALANI